MKLKITKKKTCSIDYGIMESEAE